MEQLIREILNELRNATGAPAPDADSARAKESTSASEADAGKGDANTADARRMTAPDPLPDAPLDPNRLAQIIRRHNEGRAASEQPFAKKRLLPYYLHAKEADPARWGSWNVDEALERRLVQTLRMKPRRTASGVATITVLTKPWPCSGDVPVLPQRPAHAEKLPGRRAGLPAGRTQLVRPVSAGDRPPARPSRDGPRHRQG